MSSVINKLPDIVQHSIDKQWKREPEKQCGNCGAWRSARKHSCPKCGSSIVFVGK